jgi:phage-related protein
MVGFPLSTRPPYEAIEPSYGTDLNQEFEVNRVKFGDGYSQRKVPGLNADPQKWSINWENIHDDDAETLRLFFKGLRGVDLLEWTPYNQATPLKFSANRFRSRPTGYQTQTCSIELTQEFDL